MRPERASETGLFLSRVWQAGQNALAIPASVLPDHEDRCYERRGQEARGKRDGLSFAPHASIIGRNPASPERKTYSSSSSRSFWVSASGS